MRRENLKILSAACLFMMALAVPAGAVTHYVFPGESIQEAMDAASNDDEIVVLPGTYYEAINFGGKATATVSAGT